MQPSSSSEDVAARADTNGNKTEAAAKDDDDYTGCRPGYYYEPLNMPEQGATYEASLAACNHRCRMVAGCVQFSYWPDNKSCNVQDDTSSLVPTPRCGPPRSRDPSRTVAATTSTTDTTYQQWRRSKHTPVTNGQDEDCLSGFCRPTGKCGGNS